MIRWLDEIKADHAIGFRNNLGYEAQNPVLCLVLGALNGDAHFAETRAVLTG